MENVDSLCERLYRLNKASMSEQDLQTLLSDVLNTLQGMVKSSQYDSANAVAAAAKSLRIPVRNLDLWRALIFFGQGSPVAAREALKEELRYFPENETAQDLLNQVSSFSQEQQTNIDPDLSSILPVVLQYTMVGLPRLQSLFFLAKHVCRKDIPGDFVECGVAAGGTSALLAYVIKQYSRRPRVLYCFDSFSGMPDPGPQDVHMGITAQESGWGAGTCAAPMKSLLKVCQQLDVDTLIRPVAGFFKDTLPVAVQHISSIAFLHMDGDWYDSTMDILTNVYDKVGSNAPIQVDDFGYWEGCDKALADFAQSREIPLSVRRIPGGVGGYFFKPTS